MVKFRLGSIDVRVHASFVFAIMILGMSAERPSTFAIWCAAAAVSVLLHELGHAFTGMAYGLVPKIELMGMGGQTSFQDLRDLGAAPRSFEASVRAKPIREILISFAGPFVTLLLAALLGVAMRVLRSRGASAYVLELVSLVGWTNVVWGVFNLLPVLPLDGGRIMASLMVVFRVRDAERKAMFASMILGVGIALACVAAKLFIGAVLMLLFAWRNFQARAVTGALQSETDLVEQLGQACIAMQARDGRAMMRLAEGVLAKSRTREVRSEALRILAYGQFLEGHWGSLLRLVDEMGEEIGRVELAKLAEAAGEVGRTEEAAQIQATLARMS